VVDRQRGTYALNPIRVWTKITNQGSRPAEDVSVIVLPASNELRVIGDPERYVANRLDPQVTTDTISWLVNAIPRTESGWIDIQFVVTARGLASRQCVKPVYVPEVGRPNLDCPSLSSMQMTGDTLYFDYGIGDYRDDDGTRSGTDRYNVFVITSKITNVGEAQANRVRATLLPPEGVILDVGETAVKDAGDILVQGQSSVSWQVRPIRGSQDAHRRFRILVTSDNAEDRMCPKDVVIKGAPKISTVTLPNDPVGQYGEKITVPLVIDETIGKDVYVYKLNIRYNNEAVKFLDALSVNTQTGAGWSGPRTRVYHEKDAPSDESIVRIEDFTTGSPLMSTESGVLVLLVFEAVYGGDGEHELDVLPTDLEFVPVFVSVDDVTGQDVTLVTSMNNSDDASAGTDVQLTYVNGKITVSGNCIVPLQHTGTTELTQNRPNPFNPATVIEYTLGEETDVTLRVYDQLGREVRTLVQGRQDAGRYTVEFEAGGLPSGTYLYRLETPSYTKILRMVLAR